MNIETRSTCLNSYRPWLIPLETNLTAAVFPLMKIYPAEFCVRRAREEGLITSRSLVIETSSGTMALGLAIVSKWSGYQLTVVTDYACDYLLRRRLEDLGVKVDVVSEPAIEGGYQRARLERLKEICATTKDHWWVNQYDNPANAGAYSSFAVQLIESLRRIDCLIGTVGSGGSVCGTSGYLRQLFPEMKVIGVDTFGSVLFGQPDQPRKLRGLGNSLLPQNLDHTAFDEVHWVSAAEAFKATRMLHKTTTLFRGGTSGACWLVGCYWAAKNPHDRVVCIFPDDGYRYVDTIYSDEYLTGNDLWLPELPREPREVCHPLDAGPTWSWIKWDRRTYAEAVGSIALSSAKV
jgi:cysteine synthase